MIGRRRVLLGFLAVALGLALLPGLAPAQEAQKPRALVKIGMVNTMFRDVPPALVQLLTPQFQSMMRDQTGLDGDVITTGNSHDLAKDLNDQKVQLGVFFGFEFAWAQQTYPDLKPLVVAVNRHRTLNAFLVVRNDSPLTAVTDLKGKTLSIPRRSREHCILFLDRELAALGADQKSYFSKIAAHASIEEALDDVLRGTVQAALVDGVALESYEQVKPGCHERLKILKQSDAFPPGVVAYRQGTMDDATLTRFKEGMITANQSARGKELMALWKLTAFESVPADFDQMIGSVLRAYPPAQATLSSPPPTKN